MITYTKADRFQYRTDVKALLCKGIDENETKTIQNAIMVENAMFYLSRAYVPISITRLYWIGMFDNYFTFAELKCMVKIFVMMQLIDLTGHFIMR